jgi:hypothetical protein
MTIIHRSGKKETKEIFGCQEGSYSVTLNIVNPHIFHPKKLRNLTVKEKTDLIYNYAKLMGFYNLEYK